MPEIMDPGLEQTDEFEHLLKVLFGSLKKSIVF